MNSHGKWFPTVGEDSVKLEVYVGHTPKTTTDYSPFQRDKLQVPCWFWGNKVCARHWIGFSRTSTAAFPKAKSTARYPGTKHFFIAFCWGKDQIVSQFIYPKNTKWLPPWISMSNRFSEINLTLDGFFAYGKIFTFQPKKKCFPFVPSIHAVFPRFLLPVFIGQVRSQPSS